MSWSTPCASSGTSTPRYSFIRSFQVSGRSRIAGGDAERAGEQLLLELEAQDDVQAVGRLVGVAADQSRPDRADRAHESLLVDGAERLRKEGLQLRIEPAPEAPAASDEVLPGPALRFVYGARGSARERR